MPGDGYVLSALLVALAVTVALRGVPFLVIGRLRDAQVVRFLGHHMPVGVMAILATYTLRTVPLRAWPHGLPEAMGLVVTVAAHLWRRNAVLSILAGTAVHVAALTWLFA